MRPRRQGLIDTLLPRLRVPLPPDGVALDPASLFPGLSPSADLWLEVGFGAGEHLVAQARAHPDVGMIGCEPFVNGVAALLDRIDREGLANVRVRRELRARQTGRIVRVESMVGGDFRFRRRLRNRPFPGRQRHGSG